MYTTQCCLALVVRSISHHACTGCSGHLAPSMAASTARHGAAECTPDIIRPLFYREFCPMWTSNTLQTFWIGGGAVSWPSWAMLLQTITPAYIRLGLIGTSVLHGLSMHSWGEFLLTGAAWSSEKYCKIYMTISAFFFQFGALSHAGWFSLISDF